MEDAQAPGSRTIWNFIISQKAFSPCPRLTFSQPPLTTHPLTQTAIRTFRRQQLFCIYYTILMGQLVKTCRLSCPFHSGFVDKTERLAHLVVRQSRVYTVDSRFSILNRPGSPDWILMLKSSQLHDSGTYECQVPSLSFSFKKFTHQKNYMGIKFKSTQSQCMRAVQSILV